MKEEEIIQKFNESQSKEFNEPSFWDKVGNVAMKAGIKVVYAALLAYYAMKSPSTPAKDKALIIGALAYFVSPIDVIPDGIPVIGYADDLVVLLFVLKTIHQNITDEVKNQAKVKLFDWFKSVDEAELAGVVD